MVEEETLAVTPWTAHTSDYGDNTEHGAIVLPVEWLGLTRQLYWEGGPYFVTPQKPLDPALFSVPEIVAHYADGQIAAVRNSYGRGRVFVSGPHPEAPQFWRDYFHLVDSDGLDLDLAQSMVRWAAGSQQVPLR